MRLVGLVLLLCVLIVPLGFAETFVDQERTVKIDPARGVDKLVDYESLIHFGPWDDRNYELTAGDLALLSPREASLRVPLPAFYRVELRRHMPLLERSDDSRYPLSALNIFRMVLGGYFIDGKYYRRATRDGDRYYVILENGAETPPKPEDDGSAEVISGEVRVTSPNGAAESAIAINPVDTDQLVAGSNGPNGGQRMHYSKDGGATWTQVNLPLGSTCCDPTVEWSSDGQYTYTAALGGCFIFSCKLWFYRSDDGGVTWNSLEDVTPGSPRREIASGADREFMHVDHSPVSPYKDNIYMMYHNSNVMRFAKSDDFGNSWDVQAFSSASEDRGIAGDIATDRNGHIYYAWPSFNSRTIRLRKSTNGGTSFGSTSVVASTFASFAYPIPAMEAREVAVYIAADADTTTGPFSNSVYLAWIDATGPTSSNPAANHSRIQVAYSRDGGANWTITTPHSTADQNTVDRWQTFLAVGDDGTVHVIYNDTRRSADRTSADVFYTYSTDGAATWSTPERVTAEMSPNIQDGFEYGDYSGLDIVMDDLVAIFTDNRNESGGGGDSVDVYAAGITPGGGGPSAGKIYGSRGNPGTPLTLAKTGADLALDWATVCGDGSDYAIYGGSMADFANKSSLQCTTGGATEATLTPAAGNRFYLVVAHGGGAEGSYGETSANAERTPAASPCFPQSVGACP